MRWRRGDPHFPPTGGILDQFTLLDKSIIVPEEFTVPRPGIGEDRERGER